MLPDLSDIFSHYEAVRDNADSLFAKMQATHPDCVLCHEGCSDCCHALFDLPLVEAVYFKRAFDAAFGHGAQRSAILKRASETDRKLTRLKRRLFQEEKDGQSKEAIMARAAQIKLPCPLLDENDRCLLYDARPVTCRIYGVPMAIAGQGHVCGFSAFEKGKSYPTVHLDKMQARLDDLSRELEKTLRSRFAELHEVYMPISMTLLTTYDETWLGIGPEKRE
ncbi:MAG: YkgJ family cysteine cluster protein [Desulfovibrio sp.]|jgi:Fe-S-cluster containining protein|nr:YkgJ family cysteine cluster protein [Desulfovibrio sp.]